MRRLMQSSSSPELLIDALELLSDIVSRFESTVRTMTALQNSILKAVTPLLSSDRAVIRKRSVTTLGALYLLLVLARLHQLTRATVNSHPQRVLGRRTLQLAYHRHGRQGSQGNQR